MKKTKVIIYLLFFCLIILVITGCSSYHEINDVMIIDGIGIDKVDNEYLVSLNHESNTMTFFKLDLEKGIMTMNTKPIKISEPNCIRFYKLPEA